MAALATPPIISSSIFIAPVLSMKVSAMLPQWAFSGSCCCWYSPISTFALWKGEWKPDEQRPVETICTGRSGNQCPGTTRSYRSESGYPGPWPSQGQAAFLLGAGCAVPHPLRAAHLRILPDILADFDLNQAAVGGVPEPTDLVAPQPNILQLPDLAR